VGAIRAAVARPLAVARPVAGTPVEVEASPPVAARHTLAAVVEASPPVAAVVAAVPDTINPPLHCRC